MRENEAEALFRLGLKKEVARRLQALTPAQLVTLARSNIVLCRFRLDDGSLLTSLTELEPAHELQHLPPS